MSKITEAFPGHEQSQLGNNSIPLTPTVPPASSRATVFRLRPSEKRLHFCGNADNFHKVALMSPYRTHSTFPGKESAEGMFV